MVGIEGFFGRMYSNVSKLIDLGKRVVFDI